MVWKEIEHTADVGFEVDALSLDELFKEAAFALYGVCYGNTLSDENIHDGSRYTILLDGIDLEELVVSWLNELIYIYEKHRMLFIPLTLVVRKNTWHLEADGVLVKSHSVRMSAKAATYGGLVIYEEPKPFLRIFLDV
ncbi:MAG: archease [Aminobacterium sp.]|jgi:SHS2 domain-containing protein|uniref:archease n=1 Tax=unclassified Aminobacterium TaxID=2685012 RepID=UPI001BCF2A07|nr:MULTISPECIES: archease [unclassified Aminobacterium]MDD2205935.1 archease [Aminobacterium sp.]MDD3426224.1 archease [Aminobacterium sp.]MDD3707599.1 archease [Aminobacterium sp.]MDD4227908.1 archease [Aminobacterium sp.]MDD4550652.1 archease [Aminobacterium sp.]